MRVETRCSARRKNGAVCRNYAICGGNVCRMHGGGAPQVRRRAQERILAAADANKSRAAVSRTGHGTRRSFINSINRAAARVAGDPLPRRELPG